MGPAPEPWLNRLEEYLDRQERRLPQGAALTDSILGPAGAVDPALRRAAFAGEAVAPDVDSYLEKVRRHTYGVTEEELVAVRAAGWADGQLLELTVAAIAGATFRRLRVGPRPLDR